MIKTSIIIRTYNSAGFAGNALKSILDQNLDPNVYEVLVVDDGSSDNIEAVLLPYKNKIKFFKLGHTGFLKNANRAVKLASGQFFIFLDSDDISYPGAILKMTEAMEENIKAGFVYCDYHEKEVGVKEAKYVSVQGNPFKCIAGGVIFTKEVFEKVGMYDENIFFAEYDLFLRFRQAGFSGKYLAHPAFIYNRREGSLTHDREKIRAGFDQLKEKYGELEEIKNIRKY